MGGGIMRLFQRKSTREINFLNNQKGFIVPIVLSSALIFSLGAAGLMVYATGTSRQISIERQRIKSFYIAQAATEKALAQIKQLYSNGGPANQTVFQTYVTNMSTDLPNVGGAYFSYSGVNMSLSALQTKVLTTGDYAGLNGSTQTLTVQVTASDVHLGTTTPVTLQQQIEIQLIPVFQFGVFYENDLEILPGPTMTFAGPVHSNKDIYMGVRSGGTLTFNSGITSHGNIYHGRKDNPSDAMPGDVNIKDASSVDQNMLQGGIWLDSNQSNWETESQNRWGGNVKSVDHGVQSLNVPLPVDSNQHTLIERRANTDSADIQKQKMDYKAHIRFIDGTITDSSGNTLELRYCQNGSGAIKSLSASNNCSGAGYSGYTLKNPVLAKTFFNGRENKTIKSTDLDVSMLNTLLTNTASLSGTQKTKLSSIASSATGIILYHSDRRSQGSSTYQDAFRLIEGSTIFQGNTKGMTFVSENPLYVRGNFNSSSNASIKRPVGLVGDSMNILSNSWDDTKSTQSLSNRVASNTTVQAAVIAGNTETTTGNYNGGFENIHRFLENWSSKTLTYKGSVIVLYNSQIATGNWGGTGTYYNPPNRVWSFDTTFLDPTYSIPGFPSVYQVIRSRWEVE